MLNLSTYARVLIIRLAIAGLPGVTKTDRTETKKLVDDKKTTKRHARVTKTLFCDSPKAAELQKLTTEVRNWLRVITLPGEVDGKYMIPAARFKQIADKLNEYQKKYNSIVDSFINNLAGEIALDQAGKQDLFDVSDYPTATDIARHAKFDWGFEPLPESSAFIGMFDCEALAADYADKHENHIQSMFERATQANMDRMQSRIQKSIDTLKKYAGEAGQRLASKALVANMEKDGSESRALNVANDPEVARIGQAMVDWAASYPVPENLKEPTIRAKAISELRGLIGTQIDTVEPATVPVPAGWDKIEADEPVTADGPVVDAVEASEEIDLFALDF